ncbi:MAG: sensor histidine kinase [Hyphomicrobiales bacterium]|nr:sensor histidine kinase [Hyphomicrobiales bacterium]
MQRDSFDGNQGGQGAGEKPLVTLELSHRIKNVFALVSSLVALSAREQPEMRGFAQVLQGRIFALARAHDYLSQDRRRGPADRETVHGLLGVLTAPYKGSRSRPITVEGADAPVGLNSAGTIALIVHELVTNAAKYGALSNETGTVRIVCAEADGLYSIEWREEGGPPVTGEPQRRGFGTVIAERFAAAGRVDIQRSWQPEGLRALVSMPLNDLAA